ncbi:seminal metalloprotease 1-like [Drosophila ficusphila]|uniref:seminal metalloprotease 1-like n=1 Tax=Drosophila ficusphila TaxID=30025 RepID=UPI0007E6F266|nr:seminal metalloprotease 1-like [Drosophila ficusphila]
MRTWALILAVIFLVNSCLAAPANQQRIETDPELTAGYFEGDIVLDPQGRNGLINEVYRWPDRTVYYYISPDIDTEHRNHIIRAIRIIERSSCIVFKEATTDQQYFVNVTGFPEGCYSSVGFRNRSQQLNLQTYALDSGCYRLGSIVHEFLHALGFYHQQSTWDRDEYVTIAEENITEGMEHNFNKYDNETVEDYGEPYDYSSVMHYTAYAFSKNGEMTIVPLQEGAEELMGQRLQLTQSDINKLNVMYKCPKQV